MSAIVSTERIIYFPLVILKEEIGGYWYILEEYDTNVKAVSPCGSD